MAFVCLKPKASGAVPQRAARGTREPDSWTNQTYNKRRTAGLRKKSPMKLAAAARQHFLGLPLVCSEPRLLMHTVKVWSTLEPRLWFYLFAHLAGNFVCSQACARVVASYSAVRKSNTNSSLGADAAVLAPSSGEEPAPPRHRAGVASMAWRPFMIQQWRDAATI